MKAVRMHRFGSPELLVLDEVPNAAPPNGDQVLVTVHASSVNGTDLGLRRGDLKIATLGRMPFTMGFDIAGTVKACGPEVTAFAVGDRVMSLLGHGGGGQAEEVLIPQSRLALAPAASTWAQTAAIPLAGLTALQALHGRAHLHKRPRGCEVLVIGATGGIGSFAVQLAALAGSQVSAVGSARKLEAIAHLGAHDLVPRESFEVSSERKWDVVLDAHGGLSASKSNQLLHPGGVLVTTRPISRAAVLERVVPRRLARRESRFTSVMTSARSADLTRLAALVDTARLEPLVDSVFDRSKAAQAHQHVENGSSGKVIIDMTGDQETKPGTHPRQ